MFKAWSCPAKAFFQGCSFFMVLSVLPVPLVLYCILLSLTMSASSSCYRRMGKNVKRATARVKQAWDDMSVSK